MILLVIVGLALVLVFTATRRAERRRDFFKRRTARAGARENVVPRRAAPKLVAQSGEDSISVNGRKRTYSLHFPHRHETRAAAGYPLVLAFHGGQGSGATFALRTGLNVLAEKLGFAIAYPDALPLWSDGRASTENESDDLGFVTALIAHFKSELFIDPQRIYALGASNGGMFVIRLACEMPQAFAACASVLASIPVDYAPKLPASPPTPMMMINTTGDPFVRWQGGPIPHSREHGAGGSVMAVEQAAAYWRERNRCLETPQRTQLVCDGKPVEICDYAAAPGGAEFVFAKVAFDQHIWPRGSAATGGDDGAAQFDAGEAILNFFKRQSLAQETQARSLPHGAASATRTIAGPEVMADEG